MFYVARDLCDNLLKLYRTKPKRALTYWTAGMDGYVLDSETFPLLTWKEDPLPVRLIPLVSVSESPLLQDPVPTELELYNKLHKEVGLPAMTVVAYGIYFQHWHLTLDEGNDYLLHVRGLLEEWCPESEHP